MTKFKPYSRRALSRRRLAWARDGGHEKLPGDGHETARWRP
jgi:hypothetical protein